MKTTTESITLSLGLDDAKLSPECLSTIIDTWSELQISAVEAVQAPTPNLFSFAENCLFFAVILSNETPDNGNERKITKPIDLPGKSEKQEFEWALRRSVHDARAQAQDGASPSTVAPVDTTAREQQCISPNPEGAQLSEPFEEIELIFRDYEWEGASPNLATRTYDTEDGFTIAPNRAFHSSGLHRGDDSSVTDFPRWHNLPRGRAHTGVLSDTGRTNFLPSLSRQFEPPTSTFPTSHSALNYWPSTPPEQVIATTEQKKAIGIVYLTSSALENVPAGEANIGIILTPEARGKGLASQASELVLSWVFEEIGFHRVQAGVLDSHNKDKAISMFTKFGFVHEGIRRRSVYCPNENMRGAWKDVTYLALLETDWLMRSYIKPAPKTLWDEMFARHAREREELLRWDEKQQRIKRTSSMETVRVLDTLPEMACATDEETDDPAVALTPRADTNSPVHKGKRRRLNVDVLDNSSQASSPPPSDSEQSSHSWDMGGWDSDESSGHIPLSSSAHILRNVGYSNFLSDSSNQARLSPVSATRSDTPSSSNWDLLETSSVSSSSFESLLDSDDE